MGDYEEEDETLPWYGLKAYIKTVSINEGVTSIGDYAFYECSKMTEITIPDSVTSIGDYAFYECSSLTEIEIPDSVTSIGESAFYECSFTEIKIPDSVTSIGYYAFDNCRVLKEVTLPNNITLIAYGLFTNCNSLEKVTIPDGVTSIGGYAFEYCIALKEITIPDRVTSIGRYAFSYCSALTKITIPNSVKSIGWYAFYKCFALEEITIEASEVALEIISTNGVCTVFVDCTALKSIIVACNSNKSLEDFKSAGATNATELLKTIHNYGEDDVCEGKDKRRFQEKGGYIYNNANNDTEIRTADSGVRAIDLTKIEGVTKIDDGVFTSNVFKDAVIVYVKEGDTISTGSDNNVVVKYVTDSEKLGIKINNDTEDSTYKFTVVANTKYFGGSKEEEKEYPFYLEQVDVIDNEVETSQITNYTTVADDDNNIYFKVTYGNPPEDSTVRGQVQVKKWDGENLSDVIYYVTKPYSVDTNGTIGEAQ